MCKLRTVLYSIKFANNSVSVIFFYEALTIIILNHYPSLYWVSVELPDHQHLRIFALVWKIVVEIQFLCAVLPRRQGTNANIADTRNVKYVPINRDLDEHGRLSKKIGNDTNHILTTRKAIRHNKICFKVSKNIPYDYNFICVIHDFFVNLCDIGESYNFIIIS